MGNASIDNIIVNAIVPLLAAYGRTMDESFQVDKAVAFLKAIPAEQNSITRKWSTLGDAPGSAFDSQAQRSEEHTSELQSRENLVCRLLLEKKKKTTTK